MRQFSLHLKLYEWSMPEKQMVPLTSISDFETRANVKRYVNLGHTSTEIWANLDCNPTILLYLICIKFKKQHVQILFMYVCICFLKAPCPLTFKTNPRLSKQYSHVPI